MKFYIVALMVYMCFAHLTYNWHRNYLFQTEKSATYRFSIILGMLWPLFWLTVLIVIILDLINPEIMNSIFFKIAEAEKKLTKRKKDGTE